MTDPKIVVPFKPFVMQEGMTLEGVNNAPNLSAEAKKYIAIFDADGNGTFSKREADVFNATSISTTVFGTSLNTVYKNGEVKSATIQGDVASFRYAPLGEVKPTEVPVENVVKNDKKEAETQSIPLQRTTEPRPLPPLTIVEGLDTLIFSSKRDSITYAKIDERYFQAWKQADTKAFQAWKQADAKALQAWKQADNEEELASSKGDIEGVQAAKAKKKAIYDAEDAEKKAINDAEKAEKKAIYDAEDAEKYVARKTLGVVVRPYQPKK